MNIERYIYIYELVEACFPNCGESNGHWTEKKVETDLYIGA